MKNSPLGNDPFADLETVRGPKPGAAARRKQEAPPAGERPRTAPLLPSAASLPPLPQPRTARGKTAASSSTPPDRPVIRVEKKEAGRSEGLERLVERSESQRPLHRDLRRSYLALHDDLMKAVGSATNNPVKIQRKLEGLLEAFELQMDRTLAGLPPNDGQTAALLDELIGRLRELFRWLRPSQLSHRLRDLTVFFSGEEVDAFGRDEVFVEKVMPLLDFLYRKYWRVEVSGLHNVPSEGRALLVANHSGVLPFDGAMIAYALRTEHPAERVPRFLIEDWFAALPFLSSMLAKTGQIRACQENAERLLRRDELVGVFPEGIKGIGKYYRQRYQVQRFGRGGVVRLCLRTRTPVVPVAVVGAEETYPVVGKSSYLARLTGFPFFPLTATWPWLGPLGIVPLPAKWTLEFGEPIHLEKYPAEAAGNDLLANQLNEQIRRSVQELINERLKERRSVWFG